MKNNIESRDYQDTHRIEDPLKQADEAVVIDNSYLTPSEQLTLVLKMAEEKINN